MSGLRSVRRTFSPGAVTINLIPLLLERGIDYSTAALAFGLVGAGIIMGETREAET